MTSPRPPEAIRSFLDWMRVEAGASPHTLAAYEADLGLYVARLPGEDPAHAAPDDVLDFVAGAMPLFGLIGTIVGLIGMFDSLGADVSVEVLSPQLALALKTTLYGAVFASIYTIVASRFDQRIKALEYDYEILNHALAVMVRNKATIEVQA